MNRQEAKMEYDSPGYYDLIIEILESFEDGQIISHSWMKSKLLFKDLSLDQFENFADLLKAIELQQFEYMFMIDKMRWDMLKIHKKYLKNVRGEGYMLLPPRDQVQYAYSSAMKEIKKALKQSFLMMDHVKIDTDIELKQRNTANRVKLSMLKQMIER